MLMAFVVCGTDVLRRRRSSKKFPSESTLVLWIGILLRWSSRVVRRAPRFTKRTSAQRPTHPVAPCAKKEHSMFGIKPYNYRSFTKDIMAKDLVAGRFTG